MELRINNPGLKNWILSGPSVFEALQELFFFYCKHQKTYIFRKILFGLVKIFSVSDQLVKPVQTGLDWSLQLQQLWLQSVLLRDWVVTGVCVDLHVHVPGALFLVALAAEPAAVWLLPTVRQQVLFQVILGDEGLPAQVAAKRAFLPVEAEVCLQVTFGAEALSAQAAAEWLLTCVCQLVGIQPSQLPEGFPADAALEGFLACVDPPVNLEDVDGGEALPTCLARDAVGWFVSGVVPDVQGESAVIDERLATELADIWSLPTVDSLVAPQSTRPRKGLPADTAVVRFDACVAPHVSLNVLVGFPAYVTDFAGVSVTLQMLCERF